MNTITRNLCVGLLTLITPVLALGQFTIIQELPGQSDDDYGYNGHAVIQAANGDALAFVAKNGEPTGDCCPPPGEPANLLMYRSTDNGATWGEARILDTAIEDGLQAIIIPTVATLNDGSILLTYGYINDFAPNFSVSTRVWISTDHGANWTRMNDKENVGYNLAVAPSGELFSLDAETGENGEEVLVVYRYEPGPDSWTRISSPPYDPFQTCGRYLHATSATTLTFFSSSCFFGYGGSVEAYRNVSTDGGQTWGEQEALFTNDSGFGDWGSVVTMPNGNLRAVNINGTMIATRDSTDNGATWTEATNWTAGTQENGDISPLCAPGNQGALCAFLGRRGTENQLVHVGLAGVSRDTLLGPPPVGTSHSGSWWNSDQNGHGFSIEVGEAGDGSPLVVAYWYIYDSEGNPIFFLGTGVPEDNVVTLDFVSPFGMEFGVFNPLTGDQTPPAGTGTFVFADDNNGVFSYEPSEFSTGTWGHSAIDELPVTKLFSIPTTPSLSTGPQ